MSYSTTISSSGLIVVIRPPAAIATWRPATTPAIHVTGRVTLIVKPASVGTIWRKVSAIIRIVYDAIAAATNEIEDAIHMATLKVLISIAIIGAIVATVALAHVIDKTSLSAQEQDQIIRECAGCHNESLFRDDGVHGIHDAISCLSCHDGMHQIHTSTKCQACHAGTAGLKTADEAHNVLQWVGIGCAGLLTGGLALNFGIARRRIRKRGH